MIKKIAFSLLVFTFVSCARGPIQNIQQKRYAGSWKKNFSKKNIGLSQLTSDEVSLYWGSEKGDVFRVYAKGMKKAWKKSLESSVTTPVFVHAEKLYVGTQKGSVFCLDVEKGRVLWKKIIVLQFVVLSLCLGSIFFSRV